MALKSYLQMCNDFAAEVGILGGTIASVVGQTGEAANVVRWIAEADLYIQTLYFDWSWLWAEASGNLTQDSDQMVRAVDLASVRRVPMIIGKGTNGFHEVQFMEFSNFFERYEKDVKQTTDTPGYFTQKPDYAANFLLSENIKSTGKTYYYQYYKRPVKMLANADTSAIQPFDEESARIILCRAKLWYAEREDAPEVASGASAEYEDRLARLTAAALPGKEGQYKGSNEDQPLSVSANYHGGHSYGRTW